MLGAIAGDIIGSIYKFHNIKTKDFPLFSDECTFTDDTVLTVAVAEVILNADTFPDNTKYIDQIQYIENFKLYYSEYPEVGYGDRFREWAKSNSTEPYNSWGNGSSMRVSPIASAFDDLNTVLQEAQSSAEVTHNHPEGIKGAQATATAIFLARTGYDKPTIKSYIQNSFGYNLKPTLDEVRPTYNFSDSSPDSVPEAIIAFLESTDFEDAIRNAISIGGDSDTIACITGSIAEAFYGGVPQEIAEWALSKLDERLWRVTDKFMLQYYA
ncbi:MULTISPECIES: ADP-ribosylglycohydrolase family protein [unclassified Anabaena]|uniref:ADP-ribosylglycohydrolase family protein n=1 Tax=unclassified Anabaena TaxID=2619674 RepID=UPI00144848E2|nr:MULTISPECIES: ADP-ribosylglycohydrolase family protein [unclassified Anabaena]MTJ06323.1 ADP-ribosylglycohydrolase family protein [Anabaena sp. UHCC 0204]MTJ54589.1 ADP-ribosylglycohydrolase family protein [Anabaena sp. UHCC 0253]